MLMQSNITNFKRGSQQNVNGRLPKSLWQLLHVNKGRLARVQRERASSGTDDHIVFYDSAAYWTAFILLHNTFGALIAQVEMVARL